MTKGRLRQTAVKRMIGTPNRLNACAGAMRKLLSAMALVLATSATTGAAAADRYEVSLTRKDSNLYKVDGQPYWVQTRYCYIYGYGEEAVLSAYEVVFLDDAEKCDVKRILKEMQPSAGTYKVSLSREDDDLYSTVDGIFVRTTMCLSLALGEDAILRLNGYGGGTVMFLDDDDRCNVEGVYSQARL
jgi:hypothetical protein